MPEPLAAVFVDYAERGAGDEAPTHQLLARAVADRGDLLAVMEQAPMDRRHPNNLFAAVRFLLFGATTHRLAEVYERIATGTAAEADQARLQVVDAFADFVLAHRAEVIAAMAYRGVQTNEPARSSHIAAGLALLQARHGRLAVIDVGTSAGLNLQVDRCRIDYGDVAIGPADSPLQLRCQLLADTPPVEGVTLDIGWRHGLDRDPVDLTDEASRRWLRSCIWIDQPDRSARLDQAIALAAQHPVDIAVGDAVVDLPDLIARVPEDLYLVVLTTWVTFYFDAEQRVAFEAVLAQAGRPLSWLSLEYPSVVADIPRPTTSTPSEQITPSVLGLVSHDGAGHDRREFLAWAHHHGTWLAWQTARPDH